MKTGDSVFRQTWHRGMRRAALLFASVLLAGCTTGLGGLPGGQYPGTSGYGANEVVGSVERVDLQYGRILLAPQSSRYQRASTVEVHFDQRTPLYYQGRQHPVAGLERGDVIRVDATQSGGRLWARSIEVVRNVRDGYGGGAYGGDPYRRDPYGNDPYGAEPYGNQLRGTVGHVDPRARMIHLDSGSYGGGTRLRYDYDTRVEYRGQSYRPEDLERGDLVSVRARRMGNDWLAGTIHVERSVRER